MLSAPSEVTMPLLFPTCASATVRKSCLTNGELSWSAASGNEHPAMKAHLSKYRSLVPSLALLSHLADGATGDVSLDATTRAAAWAEYLESHAKRVYASATNPPLSVAHILARHLRAGGLGKAFSARDVYL